RNTVSPVALAEAISPKVGADVLRYCLMRAIAFGQDGDFSIKDVLQRYQSELGNALGNLLNRVLPFAKEAAVIDGGSPGAAPGSAPRPPRGEPGDLERALVDEAYPVAERAVREAFDALDPTTALNALFTLLARANEYIDRAAPWAAKKKGDSA